jgi:hypothetical protein
MSTIVSQNTVDHIVGQTIFYREMIKPARFFVQPVQPAAFGTNP